MVKVIGVRFRKAGKVYYFSPGDEDIKIGQHVIVETARGVEYGYVVLGTHEVDEKKVVQPLKPVIRMATEADEETERRNKEKEKEAFKICLEKIKKHLEDGKPAKTLELEDDDEAAMIKDYNLLTAKPVIYAANVAEGELAGEDNDLVKKVREYAEAEGSEVFSICAQIEEEISELDDDEKKMFLEDLGIEESGLDKLITASYRLLGLMSFLTAGEDETRAWTIKIGTKAPQAAGKIHTDFERGFIKAEVVNYQNLLDCGSYAGAREKGLVRMEGKDYVVQDGDVILFRFNV